MMDKLTGKMKGLAIAVLLTVAACLSAQAQTILTMERALDIAEQNSPTLIRSFLNMERSQENLNAQRASLKSRFALTLNPATYSNTRQFDSYRSEWYTSESFSSNGTFSITQPILPTDATVSLSNRFGWQNSSSTRTGSSSDNKAFSNELTLRVNQPLFTYNTQRMALREIEIDFENSYISYALQRLNTERNITQQFYNVLMAQERLLISETSLKNSQANYDVIVGKVNADLSPRSELYQAELNLTDARSQLQDRQIALENSKDNLRRTLGIGIDEDIRTEAVLDNFENIDIDLDYAIDHAFRTRLELRQRELTTETLKFQMITTKARSEFKGNIDVSYGLTGDHEILGNIYDNPTQSPRVAVSFNVPIFDWGEKKARIRAQEIAQRVNQIDASEELKNIEVDIRSSYRSLLNLVNQIENARQNVVNAELTYQINSYNYRNLQITGLEMSQYESQLSNAKINYMQALIDYKIELLNMKINTLYDFENKEPIVPEIPEVAKKKKNNKK